MMATTKRRGNGEGSIFQRADGRWVGRITIGYAADGKRRQKTIYGGTKKAAQDKLTAMQGQKLDGTIGDADRETVGEYLARWLETTARTTIRESTHSNYETILRVHVLPNVGGVRLAKFRPSHVSALYATLERQGATPRTRQLVHAIVGRAMKDAVRVGMIPRNPLTAVDRPRYSKPDIHPLNAEQARTLLEAAQGDRLETLYVLALTTGCRQGELLALQWRDVDLEGGFISIRGTLQYRKGEAVVSEPKSAKGRRKIDLPALAIDALLDHRRRMLAEGFAGGEFVFVNEAGKPIDKSNMVRRSFHPLLKRAGALAEGRGEPFPHSIRFHDLRHTAATLMLLQNVNPKVVQERLGHAQIAMTLDTYSHVLPSMGADAATKIDGVLRVRRA